ncbi:uncharacterized protein LOC133331222 [Musca vetustissima]|uniref:uncharacterized protein LOC133331222 n=1 Tax=Musca vetustissima TaxID=27455 RepID=UPI002AB76D51|nr:uncharacterized protein LOC133331222 [Musca vetustissima]
MIMEYLFVIRTALLFFALVLLYLNNCLVAAVCNECQENNVACVNETSYHFCFGANIPNTEQLFTCPDGLVCTHLPNICFQRNTLPASCGDTSSCGICNSNQVFACTSRTTFAFCFGATIPSDVVGSCPTGMICDASSSDFCVRELKPTSIVCDLTEPIDIRNLYQ